MFTNAGSQIVSQIINFAYSCFQIKVPGTNFSFFSIFIGAMLTLFVIKLVANFAGIVPIFSGGDKLSQSVARYNSSDEINK